MTVTSLLTCDVRISDVIVTVSDCPVPYYFYRFCCKGGRIRLLICTVAVGMGIDIPDVSIVVIWGLPSALLQLWQEAARAGRDGRSSISLCYAYPRSIALPCDSCREDVNVLVGNT